MNSIADFNTIADLDLEPIKVKLMHDESGEGWSLDKVNAVEFEYRRFLYLMKKFPNENTAPLFDVDIFWHYHILDTQKYAIDCQAVFGFFLHHFPYVGLRGEDDEAAHQAYGARMRQLYEDTFGEAYIRDTAMLQGTPANGTLTAWSNYPGAPAIKAAWSNYPGAVASGAATIKTAWSNYPGNAASGSGAVKTAWSNYPGNTASGAGAGKTAWSNYPGNTTSDCGAVKTAWSNYPGAAASGANATQTAWSNAGQQAEATGFANAEEKAQFYAIRPRLTPYAA